MYSKQLPLMTRIGVNIGRAYPLLSGCGSFANSGLMRRFDPRTPTDITVPVTGGRASVPAHDYVGRAMLYVGDLDRKISRLVDACVQPGNVVFDIGANLGLVTLRLADRIGPSGQVHAFEPSPRLTPYLQRTCTANPHLPISLHPVALGRDRATLPLHIPLHNAGAATLRPGGDVGSSSVIDVPVHALSDYALDHGIDRADFVKVDVEGFEADVILGAQDFLRITRPKVLVLEEHAHVTPQTLPPALATLNDLGYDIFAMPRNLLRFTLVSLDHPKAAQAHDYVAVSRAPNAQDVRTRLRV